MKRTYFHLFCLLVVSLSFSVLCPQKSHAALTKQLSYQGRLNNASGQPVANGTYSIVFSIYNVSTGGSALWTETQNVSVESGGFSAYLGSVSPLTLPFNEDYYLGIKVGSDPEMTPRMKLAVVGTAAFALESDKLQGKAASDFALSTHTHTVTVGTSEITDGSITASDIDATAVQKRVTGTCTGQVLVAINQDGTVTCEADDTGGGGGTPLTPASTVQPVTSASVVGTSTNYAREDHQHNMVSNFVTDSMVSSSAGIATSKLSGTVTAISGHGLGSLATLNAVGSAQITDGTITFADIAQNGCASGQVVEWNGTAWNCGTDDVGGGGGVITNPTSTQTIIAGNSTTTPLALKAASAPIAAMFDVQDFSGGSVVKVAPSGNLLIGNPAQIAPKLSVESAGTDPTIAIKHTGSGTALDVWQAGSGMGVVVSLAAGNTNPLYDGDTSGTGNLLQLSVSGVNKFVVSNSGQITTGGMSNGVITNPSANQTITAGGPAITPLTVKAASAPTMDIFHVENNAATPLVAVSNTGNLLVGNPATTTAKVSALETGIPNYAGYFEVNNASNAAYALYATTNSSTAPSLGAVSTGGGEALVAANTGTGRAARFQISNAGNSSSLIFGNITSGTGSLLQLQQGGVDKFVVDNAGNITVGGVPNAVKNNPSANQTIQPSSDIVPLIIKDDAAAVADLFDIQNNGGTTLLKVNPSGNLLVGNPTITLAKVSAYETGSGNYAGVFSINNAGNPNAAILGTTNGTGEAVYANSTGSGAAVHGYATGTGTAGYFQTNNAGNTSPVILGDTNGTGNLLQLQQGGVNKFVVNNAGNLLVGNPAFTTAKVSAEETGTANNAGYFKISNAGNTNDAVYGYTSGSGAAVFGYGAGSGNAVYGYVSSTGKAGFFDIQNAVNSASVIVGNTTGTGYLLQLQQSYTDKFVVSNAGSILLDGNANPSIKASGATPNLILDADGTGASTVTVKNTTSPGSVTLQVNGNISAFSGSNSVPVTGATQQLILTGNTCEGVAGAQSITLSFAPAFAATPKVVATGTTATAGAGFISSITGASTSGATVNMGGTQTGTIECVDWVAIGNK